MDLVHLAEKVKTELRGKLLIALKRSFDNGSVANIHINIMQKVKTEKFFLWQKYKAAHKEISNADKQEDEMSISGVRPIKAFMEPPYLKNRDPASHFTFVLDDEMENVGFIEPKQKWTQKDLQELRQIVKENLVASMILNVNSRYNELEKQCSEKIKQEKKESNQTEDEDCVLPAKKPRRGRPTKEETQEKLKHGIIHPSVGFLLKDVGKEGLSPYVLTNMRSAEERRYRTMGFVPLLREQGPDPDEKINWNDVALKLMCRTRKFRLASDCQLAFKHEVDPKINRKHLNVADIKAAEESREVNGEGWDTITEAINEKIIGRQKPKKKKNREPTTPARLTEYNVFAKYRCRMEPDLVTASKQNWDDRMVKTIKTVLSEYPGHWRKAAAALKDEAITKRVVAEQYRKTVLTNQKVGAFSRIEDCLLLLTFERYRHIISNEGQCASIVPFLPWRSETTWRDRAQALFNDWIVPWTIEEDRLLLELAESMNKNWQKISEQFVSFKNRKGCLTRYKILNKNLKFKFETLEKYHDAYSMTRYNVFQYRHLDEVLALLKKVFKEIPVPTGGFPKHLHLLENDQEPTQAQLEYMVITYDRTLVKATIQTLKNYIKGRDKHWESWSQKVGDRKKTFDRRTFHPENPQSVASAIHIRGITLKPENSVKKLNDFEREVYTHYRRFCQTKSLRPNVIRKGIPGATFFVEWDVIKRIISTSVKEAKEIDAKAGPSNKKWVKRLEKKKRGRKSTAQESSDEEEEYYSEDTSSEEEVPRKKKTIVSTSVGKTKKSNAKAGPSSKKKRGRNPTATQKSIGDDEEVDALLEEELEEVPPPPSKKKMPTGYQTRSQKNNSLGDISEAYLVMLKSDGAFVRFIVPTYFR